MRAGTCEQEVASKDGAPPSQVERKDGAGRRAVRSKTARRARDGSTALNRRLTRCCARALRAADWARACVMTACRSSSRLASRFPSASSVRPMHVRVVSSRLHSLTHASMRRWCNRQGKTATVEARHALRACSNLDSPFSLILGQTGTKPDQRRAAQRLHGEGASVGAWLAPHCRDRIRDLPVHLVLQELAQTQGRNGRI